MPSRALLTTSALLALGAALAWVSCTRPAAEPTSDLRLLWSGGVMGFVEPCGCTAGRLGGLDRLASAVRSELGAHPAALFVEAGNLVARRPMNDGLLEQQLPFKTEAFLRVYGELGLSALAVGVHDLAIEVDELIGLAERHGVPLISANLQREDGSLAFRPYVIVERGGRRIGITSAIARRLRSDDMDHRQDFDVEHLAGRRGLSVAPWRPALEAVVAELRPEVDVLLLASHLGNRHNRALPETLPGLDLIFGPHFDDADRPYTISGNTPVLVSPVRGARLGIVDWWWPQPRAYFGPEQPGALTDLSARAWLPRELTLHRESLALLAGRESVLGRAEHARQRDTHLRGLAEIERGLAEQGPWPRVNAFASMSVPLSASVRRDEFALDSLDRYHEALHAHWTAEESVVQHPNERFVGYQSCSDCHPAQVEFWYTTDHSRAIHTLAATLQHVDMECIACHTVGHAQAGGFRRPNAMSGFENVQCAACHGPGGPHVEGGASFLDVERLLRPTGTCVQCHDKEHDPGFESEAAAKVVRVACPPMGPPAERTTAHRVALHGAASALAEAQGRDWGRVSDAFLRAGDPQAALGAAERWLGEERGSVSAHLKLAQRLIDVGRPDEALPLLERVLSRQPQSGQAWMLRSAALLRSDPQAAMAAALEAYTVRPDDVDAIRLLVAAQAAAGQRFEALQLLRAYLERRPQDRERVQDLLDELR